MLLVSLCPTSIRSHRLHPNWHLLHDPLDICLRLLPPTPPTMNAKTGTHNTRFAPHTHTHKGVRAHTHTHAHILLLMGEGKNDKRHAEMAHTNAVRYPRASILLRKGPFHICKTSISERPPYCFATVVANLVPMLNLLSVDILVRLPGQQSLVSENAAECTRECFQRSGCSHQCSRECSSCRSRLRERERAPFRALAGAPKHSREHSREHFGDFPVLPAETRTPEAAGRVSTSPCNPI